jgi:hypothetical protein
MAPNMAFKCAGTCGGVCDRPWRCRTVDCPEHDEELSPTHAVYRCPTCHSCESLPGACDGHDCGGARREARVQCADCSDNDMDADNVSACDHCQVVLDVSQLPALVPATLVGSDIDPPLEYSENVVVVPTAPVELEWASRFVNYTDVELSVATPAADAAAAEGCSNFLACVVGQRVKLKFAWSSRFDPTPDVYCPGCVVQMYVGMAGAFSYGFISALRGAQRGVDSVEFDAPSSPGVYYVTQQFSLQYNFVTVNHPNIPRNAMAVLRVLPFMGVDMDPF